MINSTPPELIGIADAARILGVSSDRVRQLDEFLAPYRAGRIRVYSRSQVIRYRAYRDAASAERAARKARR